MPTPPDDRRCTAIRPDGDRCGTWARGDDTLCRAHGGAPPDDRRCTGIATGGTTRPERKGERCLNWAIPGGTVCDSHGGSAPQVRMAAARRQAEGQLMAKAANLVGTPVDNPLTELASLAGRARAWMDLLEGRIQKLLEAGDENSDGDSDAGGIRYRGGAGEQIRGEIQLYERAMDRLGKFLADYGRLNVDERLLKISERQADAVVAAIDAAIAYLGATGEQAVEAKKIAARHLRTVRAS